MELKNGRLRMGGRLTGIESRMSGDGSEKVVLPLCQKGSFDDGKGARNANPCFSAVSHLCSLGAGSYELMI